MSTILRIDASSRLQGSHSRELADYWVEIWSQHHPQDLIVVRDLVETSLPHLSQTAITGFYTPPEQQTLAMQEATQVSDELIDELQNADILLLSVPMYNFSVPSALKAWIDQIVRIGRTFAYDGNSFTGLVEIEKAYIICAYGATGYVNGGDFAALNFLEPYLQGLFGFLGIKEIKFFHLEGTAEDKSTVDENTEKLKQAIKTAIKH